MGNILSLEEIRRRIDLNALCPNCAHDLTIEDTEYFHVELCENCFEYCQIDQREPCCSNPKYKKVKLIISGGGIQVREQCTSCGNLKGNSIGGLSKEERAALPEANIKARESFYDRIRIIRNELGDNYRLRRNEFLAAQINKKKDDWFREYTKYLQSPEWIEKRELVLKRDNYLCQCCLKNRASQVHHKSYEFVDLSGSEPAFDLVSVCKSCHDRIEEMKKENKKSSNGQLNENG